MNEQRVFWQKLKNKSLGTKLVNGSIENEISHKTDHRTHDRECFNTMKSRQTITKLPTNLKGKHFAERVKLDAKSIEHLVTTIEELKNRVRYFENFFNYEVANQKGNDKIQKQFEDLNHIEGNYVTGDTNEKLKSCKLSSYLKNLGDSKETEKFAINPLLAPIPHEIKQKSVGSDASIVKSSLSLTKNTYININPTLDSKHLKSAAQDFIKQAEELKTNIGYMLDNDHYDNITVSDISENRANSIVVMQNNEDSDAYNTGVEQNLQYLLESVSVQYDEILKMLENIEQHMKNSKKQKFNNNLKLSQTSAKVSSYIPNSMYKVESCKSNGINTNIGIHCEKAKVVKKKNLLKKLDPIVLVYEPIKPTVILQDACTFCGRGSNSCVFGSCRNHLVNPGLDEKQDVSCGFMVSYTPNLSQSYKTDSKGGSHKKDYKKVKKKKRSCLWF